MHLHHASRYCRFKLHAYLKTTHVYYWSICNFLSGWEILYTKIWPKFGSHQWEVLSVLKNELFFYHSWFVFMGGGGELWKKASECLMWCILISQQVLHTLFAGQKYIYFLHFNIFFQQYKEEKLGKGQK